MLQFIFLLFTPILSLIVFTLGSGLLTTLITVRLHLEGGGAWIVGLITAVYYTGLVLGSFCNDNLIRRVGHIRVYAGFAAILAVATLLQGIFVSEWVWLLLRFIIGYSIAALYIAIESWLLVVAPPKRRGQVLSLYMISFYAALATGQFFLNLSDPKTIVPFCIAAILFSLSIVPLSMTRATSPALEDISPLSMRKLYKISPSGIFGCFCGGLITSVIYGLMPLFIKQLKYSTPYVATVMGLIIFGAMFIQYPIGRLSDYMERRKMLIATSFMTLCVSLILMLFAIVHISLIFLIFMFIFGGVAFVIYPLSISHTCDYLESKDIVAATQGLLLANGVGSIIGPLIVPWFILVMGPLGLFVYFGLTGGILGLFFSWRRTKRPGPSIEEQQGFVAVPRTTPIATGFDPRAK